MKKIFTLLYLVPLVTMAQVTIRITSLPSNTPVGSTIYFAGSINSWNAQDATFVLAYDSFGVPKITIPEGTGSVEFKFTRGGWPTVEGNATGGFLPNRTFTFTGSPQTLNLTIQSWEDLGNTNGSTAAANVSILNPAFYMPQLDRYRKVWLYLPPDYNSSTKHYPVLYMQDGQNLFDDATSFAGEWQVDETLNNLFAGGDYGAIVVGIENGGAERLNEYSPWNNPSYGGGLGDEYAAFLANTLKPYIDANYRTRPEPQFNALIGSSMGALISTYGATEFPGIFRKVGSMSPAYWFAMSDLHNYLANGNFDLSNHRVYFVCGTGESSSMVADVNTVKTDLIAKGMNPSNVFTKFDPDGTHTESYWRGQFGSLYQWLFPASELAAAQHESISPKIIQTVSGKLFVEGIPDPLRFEIVSMTGQTVGAMDLSNGVFELPESLARGIYILRSGVGNSKPIRINKS
ncbi:MAG: alpha/beta hydrolase [Flavobacterium sp.]|nr:MAG: alpha/beta hydrolase [Flavobacterium sp.]